MISIAMAENEEDDVGGGDGHDQPDYDEPLSPLSPDLAHEFEDGVTKEELAAHGLPPLPKVGRQVGAHCT